MPSMKEILKANSVQIKVAISSQLAFMLELTFFFQ
jgi:hypothetical protein